MSQFRGMSGQNDSSSYFRKTEGRIPKITFQSMDATKTKNTTGENGFNTPNRFEEHNACTLSNNTVTKPSLSYVALISMAIQSCSEKRMLLSEIYQWITNNFPYYKMENRSWRNSIRHNLSLNECFVKSGRSEHGKGNYWTIHVATMDDFDQGDYRRRHARTRVRKCEEEVRKLTIALSSDEPVRSVDVKEAVSPASSHGASTQCNLDFGPDGYVPMTSTLQTTTELISTFGMDAILTKEEQLQRVHSLHGHSAIISIDHDDKQNHRQLPASSNLFKIFYDQTHQLRESVAEGSSSV